MLCPLDIFLRKEKKANRSPYWICQEFPKANWIGYSFLVRLGCPSTRYDLGTTFPCLRVRPCKDWNWIWLLLVFFARVSSLMILVLNNGSKFYSYFYFSSFFYCELLKDHSPLSALVKLLFLDWRTNLKTHSKDLHVRCCLKKYNFKLETLIKTHTSVSHRFDTEFSLLLRRMGENSSCLENCTPKQRLMGTNIISTCWFHTKTKAIIQER